MNDRSQLMTELRLPESMNLDAMSSEEAVAVMNQQDMVAVQAATNARADVARAIDHVVAALSKGGRVFYFGAGTSGRLGVLDASEIPPTFGVSYDLVQGVMAGGYDALYQASEASEDNREAGAKDMQTRGLTEKDAVIGIAASGRTPYTIGAVEYARNLGCFTACIACVPDSVLTQTAEIAIVPVVGAEAITGSSRMKAGTAQKLILNMISTVSMIRLGYVKGNRMTNVKASNLKLKSRSLRILMSETGLDEVTAKEFMQKANEDLRVAIVMFRAKVDAETAKNSLMENDFVVDRAVENITKSA